MNGKLVKLTSLRRDLAREDKGDWVDYPAWGGDVAFNVSSLERDEYLVAYAAMMKALHKEHGAKIPSSAFIRAHGQLYSDHVLHGWRGLDVEYSEETAERYMTDPEYVTLINAVEFCAKKLTNVEAELIEVAAKNSETPSATS